jgi:hypothetical protein
VVVKLVVDSHIPMAVTAIVGSLMSENDEEEKHVFKEPIDNHEEQQQPPIQVVPHNEPPRRSQMIRRSAMSDEYEVYVSEEIQMDGDLTSFEEAMRSAYSSK